MNKHFSLYTLFSLFAVAFGFTACNDDSGSDSPLDTSDQFAVMINSFSLKADDSILVNLDSVFFSIDLNNARVFNADSLPLGTRVDSLGVTMTFSSVSKAEITMPSKSGQKDTIVDYLNDSGTAIDFSRGYVTLHLESANEVTKRDYRIYVNVHKMKPDSLTWGDAQWTSYPTSIAVPTATKAIEYNGKAICYATDGSRLTIATSETPELNNWQSSSVALPAGLDISSITAGTDAIYALDAQGNLMQSADEGSNWSALDGHFSYIYGVYENTVIGVDKTDAGQYNYVTYPASTVTPVPADAPVAGTSQAVTFVSEWADEPMMMVLGGVTASGSFTGDMWAYDGNEWVSLTSDPVPAAKGVTMVPYFTYRIGSNWAATKRSTLLAFGGVKADGTENRELYISQDRGIHWTLAGELMQLPEAFPSLEGAQALVFNRLMTSRAVVAKGWHSAELPVVPTWFVVQDYTTGIKPIESWDCPYIYLFGGKLMNGSVNTEIWRGVINRLSFKPLQ